MAASAAASAGGGGLRPFVATTTILLIVAAMYLARAVVVPVVLSGLLTFLLTPLVSRLQHWGVPRVAAAVATALLAFGFFGVILAVVAVQFQSLAADLPTHREQILKKADGLHQMISGDWLQNLIELYDDTVRTISPPKPAPAAQPVAQEVAEPAPPAAIVTAPTSHFWGPFMEWAFAPALEIGVDVGIILVLVVFMLAQHDDLRNRIIRLSGTRNVTNTTKALGDAAHRVRRYLLHQFFINCAFGLIVAVGLWLIGAPYPWLWGVLGAVLRYVPYIGTWLAAVCPVLLAAALTDGWTRPALTFGLFAMLDILITNALEPVVYGRSIGVSGTALLIAAVFWTWLWGPIGLILSTPLTACVVVLGRHVAHLEYLSVILGDQPPLSLPLSFYQRLLARDEEEAGKLVEEYIQKNGVENIYDHMLVPALVHAKENRERGGVTPEDEEFILSATRELLEDVVFPQQDAANAKEAAADGEALKCRLLILGCPAKDAVDETALMMLQRLLPAGRCQVEVLTKDVLAGEVLARVGEGKPAVVVIGATPPYSFSTIRYLCKKLRAQAPTVKILVGCWGLREDVRQTMDRLQGAGADQASAELLETRSLLLPLIQEAAVVRAAEAPKPEELVRA